MGHARGRPAGPPVHRNFWHRPDPLPHGSAPRDRRRRRGQAGQGPARCVEPRHGAHRPVQAHRRQELPGRSQDRGHRHQDGGVGQHRRPGRDQGQGRGPGAGAHRRVLPVRPGQGRCAGVEQDLQGAVPFSPAPGPQVRRRRGQVLHRRAGHLHHQDRLRHRQAQVAPVAHLRHGLRRLRGVQGLPHRQPERAARLVPKGDHRLHLLPVAQHRPVRGGLWRRPGQADLQVRRPEHRRRVQPLGRQHRLDPEQGRQRRALRHQHQRQDLEAPDQELGNRHLAHLVPGRQPDRLRLQPGRDPADLCHELLRRQRPAPDLPGQLQPGACLVSAQGPAPGGLHRPRREGRV